MTDERKTKAQLVREVEILRTKLTKLEKSQEKDKHSEKALRESEKRSRNMFEDSNAGYFFVDRDGYFREVNNAWLRLHKYDSPEEILGRHFYTTQVDVDKSAADKIVAQLLSNEKPATGEFTRRCMDGSVGWHSYTISPVRIGGKVVGLEGFLIDITERKRAEQALRESEERFRLLYENSTIGLYRTTPEGRILLANPSLVKMLGYSSAKQLMTRNLEKEGFEPSYDRKHFLARIEKDGEVKGLESAWTRQDGSIVYVRESARAIRDSRGNTLYYDGTVEDVTERKQAEEELKRFFDLVPDMVCIASPDGHFKKVNRAWEAALGFSQEEIVATTFPALIHPDDLQPTLTEVEKQLAGGSTAHFVNRYRRKDGSYRWFEWMATPAIDPSTLYAAARDITERKQSEERIHESESRYRQLVENSGTSIVIIDRDGTYRLVNEIAAKAFGRPRKEIEGRSIFDLLPRETAQRYLESNRALIDSGGHREYEDSFSLADGQRTFLIIDQVLQDVNGLNYAVQSSSIEITERKRAEEELRESENRFRLLADATFEGIAIHEEGKILEANLALCTLFGYDGPDEVIGKSALELAAPESRDLVALNIRSGMEEPYEAVGLRKDGTRILGELRGRTIRYKERIVRITAIRDITDRKRVVEDLHRAFEWHQAIFEGSRDAIFISDRESLFVAVNEAACGLTGYSREQLLTMRIPDIHDHPDLGAYEMYHQRIFDGEEILSEAKILRCDGSKVDTEFNNKRVTIAGKFLMHTTARDITKRKEMELELLSAFQKLKEANRLAQIGTWDWLRESDTVTWSEELYSIAGRDPSLPAPTYSEHSRVYTPASWNRLSSAATEALRSGEPYNIELELVRPDGSTRWTNAFGGVKRDGNGKIIGLHGVLQDITERKRAEGMLRDSQKKFQALVETTGDFIWEMDSRGSYTYCSPQLETLWGLDPKEILGKTPFDLLPAKDKERALKGFSELSESRSPFKNLELSSLDATGQIKLIEISGVPFFDMEGKLSGYRGITRDITERKRAEEALRYQNELVARIAETSPVGITMMNREGQITFANHRAEEVLGLTQDRLGKTAYNSPEWHITDDAGNPFPSEKLPFRQVMVSAQPVYDVRHAIEWSDGRRIFLSINAAPLFDRDRSVSGVVATVEDITERKRAEEAVRESEKRLRDIIFSAGDWIWEVNEKGVYTFSSQKGFDLFGPSHENVIGKTPFDLMPPDEAKRVGVIFSELLANKMPIKDLENWNINRNGEKICLLTNGVPILDDQGNLKGYRGVDKDITARKQAEEALRESEKRFRHLIEQAPIAVSVTRDGVCLFGNARFATIFQLRSPEQAIGLSALDVYAPQCREESKERMRRRSLGLPVPSEFEAVGLRADGSQFPMHVAVARVELTDGMANVAFISEITERKRAETMLKGIVSKNPMSIQILDKEGLTLEVNTSFMRLFGAAPPSDYSIFNDAQLAQRGMGEFFDQLRNGEVVHFPDVHFNVHDSISEAPDVPVWVRTVGFPLNDSDDKPNRYVLMHENISEAKLAEQALREKDELLSLFIRRSPIYAYIKEAAPTESRVVHASDNYDQMIGISGQNMTGKTMEELFPPEFAAKMNADDWAVVVEGKVLQQEEELNGRHFETIKFPIVQGKKTLLAGYTIDITERKRAEEELKKEHALLSTVIEAIPDQICLKDTDSRYVLANKASVEALGANSMAEMIGKTDLDYVRPDLALRLLAEEKAILESGKPSVAREMVRVDPTTGEIRKCHLYTKVPVKDPGGKAIGLLVVNVDITQRKLDEERVRRSEMRLRQLAAHLESVREEERKHIAQEFHDQLGQTLTALKMDLSLLRRKLADGKQEISRATLIEEIQSSQGLIDSGIQTVRAIMSELRPELLDQLGLLEALQWEVGTFQQRTGVMCGLSADVGDLQFDARRSIALFRLVQEALTNVARHAQATRVDVIMRTEGNDLICEIKDDGIGIAFGAENKPRSFGLIGMRERAILLGGELGITGTMGKGTTILVRMPIHETLRDGGGGRYKRDVKEEKN